MEAKRRLVYILHHIAIGGVEVALLSAIPELNKKYNLKVVVLGQIDQQMIAGLTPEERNVFVSFDFPVYLYPVRVRSVVKHILDFQPDVVICSLWRASMVGSIVKKLNSKILLYSFNHNTRFAHFFSANFIKMAIRSADVILTDSSATSNFVRDEFNPDVPIRQVSFLTHATPTQPVVSAPEPGQEVKFLFLGRISPVKNLPLIIKVIHELRQKSIEATLDIYGKDHGASKEAQTITADLGLENYVRFKGEVENNKRTELFKHYHFYIQLSSYEGMAMSVAEAMQHGLVCIVSPVGEIVHYSKDMDSAIFIPIEEGNNQAPDISKICNVIEDNSLYKNLSEKCHQNFLRKKQYKYSLIEEIESSR